MEQLLKFGKKAVKYRSIEGVILYNDEVTIQTANNRYTVYYCSKEAAEEAYNAIIEKIEARGNTL